MVELRHPARPNIIASANVHYSHTRRKACERCVKGKRRCDLIFPRCGRCVRRGAECDYVSQALSATCKESEGFEPAQYFTLQVTASDANDNEVSQPDYGSEQGSEAFEAFEEQSSCSQLPPNSDLGFLVPISSLPAASRVVISPLHFNYLTTFLCSTISSLALENRTSFIHPSSLSEPIPPPLDSALFVSALCSLRAPSTYPVLESRFSALIAFSHASFHSPTLILHSVQALIIFQIVRLLSHDQQQISSAEKDFHRLNKWTITLQTAYFTLPSTAISYEHWILKESIRRTILISVILRSFYCFSKDGYTELVPLLGSLPVSLNARPWELKKEDVEEHEYRKEHVSSYWDFVCGWSQRSIEEEGKRKCGFEKLLLCLEEDGRIGEAGWELIHNVNLGRV